MKVINKGERMWQQVVCLSCNTTLEITKDDIYRYREHDETWYEYGAKCICGKEICLHNLPEDVKCSALRKSIFNMKPESLSLRDVPDFPKPGIIFKDIAPLLANPQEMKQLITYLAGYWERKGITKVGGFDARGFIFGSLLAHSMNLPFFMLRKKGKLPGECEQVSYDLEYGSATLEMQMDAVKQGEKVLLIDDLLATGGTALAGCQLVEKAGGVVVGCQFIIELAELPGKEKLSGYNVKSIITG